MSDEKEVVEEVVEEAPASSAVRSLSGEVFKDSAAFIKAKKASLKEAE